MSKQILRALCPSSLNKRAITQLDYKRSSRFMKLAVLVSLFTLSTASNALAQEPYQRLVRKFATSELGIPNPAGLAFSPAADALLVAPSPGSTDLIIVTLVRDLAGSATVATAVPNPVNMAFDGKFNSLLFFDSGPEELIEIRAGANGRPQPSPGAITRFNALPFVVKHAQGMTLDPETGDLFFLVVPAQPAVPAIVRIVPDPQDRFARPVVSNIVLNSLRQYELRGIAFNPSDGHFYIMSPAEQELYEVTQKGEVLTTRDLSAFELGDVQNMAFAPSGDQTDDPAVMSLYIADSGLSSKQGLGDITELSLTQPEQHDLSAITAQSSLIQTTFTSQWSPPSPDPAGAAYFPPSNNLLISDSEVNEMQIFAGVNLWQVTLSGSQIQEFSTYPTFSDEPTGVAYNPGNQHLFFTDDTGTRSVYELNPGPDGLYGTSDDIVTSFKTNDFGSSDPEGIAYDIFQGHLFIADGLNAEVYEVSPGANALFDGVPPTGDDVVTHFDTAVLGLLDPEGIEFNSDNGTLYIVSRGDNIVVETTTTGTAVRVIDIAFLNARAASGLAMAPSSVNASERSLYITDRGVDNDSNPDENDGKMYEISLGSFTPSLSINDVAVLEGDAGTVNAVFTVTLSNISQQTVTVDYATQDGTATAGSDYVAVTGQVSFQPGQISQAVTVVVIGDPTDEPDETFFVNLSNAVNANIGDNQGMGTITDDDGPDPITLSFQDGVNGYNGTRDTKLKSGAPNTNYGSHTTLELDGDPDESSLLYWDLTIIPAGSIIQSVAITVNITNTSGADYELYELKRPWVESEATWNEYAFGQNWQVAGADGSEDRGSVVLGAITGPSLGLNTISLNLAGVAVVQSWVDNASSNHGFISLDYINASNGLDFSSRETVTVSNRPKLTVTYVGSGEPPPEPSLSINDVVVTEGNAGTVNAVFTVTLSAASGQTVTVNYATADGTATAGSDYVAVSGQVSFSPGETSQPVTVVVNGDVLDEPNETFFVNLSNAVNATIGDNQGTGTINDDDATPSLAINDVAVTEGNAGTVDAVFTVTLSAASGQTVTVDYATADGSATAGSDYVAASGQVTFQPGQTSQPVTVVVNGDELEEPNETFFVNLSNAVNATIGNDQGTGTITNDDGLQQPVTVSFQDGVGGYTGTRDTKLVSGSPTTNYGTVTRLELDGSPDVSSLISWDLASIPAGSIIHSVDITVNVTNASKQSYEFYEMKRPWIESAATWNQYASGLSWEVAGADGSGDRGSTVLGALTAASRGVRTISLNASGVAVVQSWVDNPSSNYGFIILNYVSATDGLTFYSRENGTASNRPKLTVTYSAGRQAKVASPPTSESGEAEPSTETLPQTIALNPGYPNPFNLETRIEYALPEPGRVSLVIYNVRGQQVRKLVDEIQSGGYKRALWNGRDEFGQEVGSGVYFIRLMVGRESFVRKVSLLK